MTDACLSTTTTTTAISSLVPNAESPSVDSPATPVNLNTAPDVKIDVDYQEESDARNEPYQVEKVSTFAVLGTTTDPGTSRYFVLNPSFV
jgi:hypothetical protein